MSSEAGGMRLTEDPAKTCAVCHHVATDHSVTWGSEHQPGLGSLQKGLKISNLESDKCMIKPTFLFSVFSK